MRIIHTADWHLGKSLEKRSRLSEQAGLELGQAEQGLAVQQAEAAAAAQALESLRHERFMFGVISHVPELRNRLPRQLQVMPAEPGGSGTLLRIV